MENQFFVLKYSIKKVWIDKPLFNKNEKEHMLIFIHSFIYYWNGV